MQTQTDKKINRVITLLRKEKTLTGQYLVEEEFCNLMITNLQEIKKIAKEDSYRDKYDNKVI
jgi:hypothetical protein